MQAVLLDLDGTLVDTEPYWVESQRLLAEQFSIEWTLRDEMSLIGHSMSYSADKLIGSGVNLTRDQVMEFRLSHVISRLGERIPWKPGAEKLLQHLRGSNVLCALVTMSPEAVATTITASLPPAQFHAVVTGSDCANGKPHPEPYLRALSLLGVAPADAIAVEDSKPGVQSAEAAGLNVLVVPGPLPMEQGPRRTHIESLEEVKSRLQGLSLQLLPSIFRRNEGKQ